MSAHPAPSPIGFVGLGQMGSVMAKHILASGREVIGWDREAEAVSAFAAAGGTAAATLSALRDCPVVIGIVFDDTATRDVTLGEGGLLTAMAPDAVHVVMASISPALSRELADAHAAKGQRYLAASVFGRPEAAAAAQLWINCSGAQDAFDAAQPVLATLGKPQWIGEEPEKAMLVKSVGNSMITVIAELLREMFAVLDAGGVDGPLAKQLLIDTLFAGPIFSGYSQLYINQPDLVRMTDIARKDRNACLAAAAALGVDMPVVRYLAEQNLP
jgi:3-hydroxyisobutyrate dehydrogenase-like beta-hydroxyacid dehydrogenase